MKKGLFIGAVIVVFSFCHAQNGDDLYRLGDYQAAAEAYEAVVSEGLTSPELYYNLAGAYYHEGQMGKAILNYERALRLDPTFADARENLALANSRTADHIAVLPQPIFVRWWEGLCTAMLPSGWRMVWLVLLALLASAVVVLRIGSSLKLRKAALAATAVTAILLLTATAVLIGSTKRFNAHSEAIVTQQALTLKASPDAKSADRMVVHEGTKATVTDSLQDWYKVRLSDGTIAWCEKRGLERI